MDKRDVTMYRFLFTAIIIFTLFSSSFVLADQAQFKHKLITLTLPEGWTVNKNLATNNELIGYAPDVSGAKMEKDFLEILKSAE